MKTLVRLLFLIGMLFLETSYAFEDTKVLPKGIRRINFTALSSRITEKTDNSGNKVSVIDRLNRDVRFGLLATTQTGLRGTSIPAFLSDVGGDDQSSAGSFLADAGLDLAGYGLQFNYGITDNITLGVGLPVYKASVRLSTGFRMSDTSRKLVGLLTKPEYNQVEAARQVLSKLNNPGPVLNQLLLKNNYKELQNWEGSGIGDLVVGAKWRAYQGPGINLALTTGIVVPTGERDDSSVLNDFRMGDGQYDLFQTFCVDKQLTKQWLVATHLKYTYQAPGKKKLRHETAEVLFSPTVSESSFKLGDKVELGAFTSYTMPVGLDFKTGLIANSKASDRYKNLPSDVAKNYEKNTKSRGYVWENAIGYSSIEAFKRKEVSIPFSLQLGYKKQLSSVNTPVSDQASLDFAVFF